MESHPHETRTTHAVLTLTPARLGLPSKEMGGRKKMGDQEIMAMMLGLLGILEYCHLNADIVEISLPGGRDVSCARGFSA